MSLDRNNYKQETFFKSKHLHGIRRIKGDKEVNEFDENYFTNLIKNNNVTIIKSEKVVTFQQQQKFHAEVLKSNNRNINNNQYIIDIHNERVNRKSSIIFKDLTKNDFMRIKERTLTPSPQRKKSAIKEIENVEKIEENNHKIVNKSFGKIDLKQDEDNNKMRISLIKVNDKKYKINTNESSAIKLPPNCKYIKI
jgi:hypothetical protein